MNFSLIFAIWIACTVLTALFTWMRSTKMGGPVTNFYEYSSPLVVLATAAAFITVRAAIAKLVSRYQEVEPLIAHAGKVSFGVYLMHPLVIWLLDARGLDYQTINPWLCIPLLSIAVFVICAFIVQTLQRIPYLRLIVP